MRVAYPPYVSGGILSTAPDRLPYHSTKGVLRRVDKLAVSEAERRGASTSCSD